MYFDSLIDFIQMAGHGKYVWSCVILSSLLLGILFAVARHQFKRQHKLSSQLGLVPK